jgi:predicted outer membrane lipoprotein
VEPETIMWAIIIVWAALVLAGVFAVLIGMWLDLRERQRTEAEYAVMLRALEDIHRQEGDQS